MNDVDCDSVVQLIISTTFGHTQDRKPAPNVPALLSEKGDVATTTNTPVNSANRAFTRLPLSAIDPNIPPQRTKGTPYDELPKRSAEESHISKFDEITLSPNSLGDSRSNVLFSTSRLSTYSQSSSPVCPPSTPPPTSQGSLVLSSGEHIVAQRRESLQYRCIRFPDVNDPSEPPVSNSAGAPSANEFTARFHAPEHEQHQSECTFYAAKQWTLGPGTELKVLPGAVPDAEYHDDHVAHPTPVEPNSLIGYRITGYLFGW